MRKGKSYQVMNKVRGRWEGICIKCISQHFSLPIFLSIWEDKKSRSERENFLSCFLSLPFSFLNQIVENNIFHSIFLFFIFHPTCFHPNQTHPKRSILNKSKWAVHRTKNCVYVPNFLKIGSKIIIFTLLWPANSPKLIQLIIFFSVKGRLRLGWVRVSRLTNLSNLT